MPLVLSSFLIWVDSHLVVDWKYTQKIVFWCINCYDNSSLFVFVFNFIVLSTFYIFPYIYSFLNFNSHEAFCSLILVVGVIPSGAFSTYGSNDPSTKSNVMEKRCRSLSARFPIDDNSTSLEKWYLRLIRI